jgi:hypothetical protein
MTRSTLIPAAREIINVNNDHNGPAAREINNVNDDHNGPAAREIDNVNGDDNGITCRNQDLDYHKIIQYFYKIIQHQLLHIFHGFIGPKPIRYRPTAQNGYHSNGGWCPGARIPLIYRPKSAHKFGFNH